MIALPYPHKALWPNGRAHWGEKSREAKKHKQWAYIGARAAAISVADGPMPIHITVCPKSRGVAPDRDNCVAAAKSYLDGIADALGINDRHFAAPTVTISPERTGQFIITVGETE